jgi:uncharacterized protein (TIGR02453 family)
MSNQGPAVRMPPMSSTHSPAGFGGWPPEALAFFEGLAADNSRAWFQANKDVYERGVRAPLEALLAELAPAYGDGKVFRLNRDVRFSADKSPYKTWAAAVAGPYYVQLSADGLLAAAGYHHMAADQLERFRAAAGAEASGGELARLVEALEADGVEIGGEQLRSAPRGWARDHPRIRLLRHKGLTAHRTWPPAPWLHTPEALERVRSAWRQFEPLIAWLDREVGPSTLPPPERPGR